MGDEYRDVLDNRCASLSDVQEELTMSKLNLKNTKAKLMEKENVFKAESIDIENLKQEMKYWLKAIAETKALLNEEKLKLHEKESYFLKCKAEYVTIQEKNKGLEDCVVTLRK